MAVYPAGNPGVFPLDPATPVGEFRLLYGDTTSEPYDPVVPGFQNYEELSDEEIEQFLSQGGGSVPRGIGYMYLALSGQAAKASRLTKDYDLTLDATKRATDLLAVARMWFAQADEDDEAAGGNDIFEVFDMAPKRCGCYELAERCRC